MVHEVLSIPLDYTVITLIIIGQKDPIIHDDLSDKQKDNEQKRPPRLSLDEIVFHNQFPT
jgi:hypothetical protein